MKTVRVSYFALLREERGQSQEEVVTAAETAGQLYDDLAKAHGFSLPGSRLRVDGAGLAGGAPTGILDRRARGRGHVGCAAD